MFVFFEDSTRAQFEERQNDAEIKLNELRVELGKLSQNPVEEKKHSSDDEDENEARLSCSLRWLINKAYPHGSIPDYLPTEHFFQNENGERFLSPDIALVLLSGDLYIRAFQSITNQQDQLISYEDLINYFYLQNIIIDINLLKQDDPLNAHVHLELIDNLMKLYFQIIFDQLLRIYLK